MQSYPKNKPFLPIKHLFCLKKRSKWTFQPVKVCSKLVCLEGSWVAFEFFLLHFYEGLHNFWTVFWPLLTPFWPFFERDFGPILGRSRFYFGVTLGSFWHRFGNVLRLFWCRFDLVLRPFWGFFLALFCVAFFGHFYGYIAFVLWCFGKLAAKLSKMMQEKANVCNFSAEIRQNDAKSLQEQAFFGYKTPVLL